MTQIQWAPTFFVRLSFVLALVRALALALALATFALVPAAQAAGQHAGGHGSSSSIGEPGRSHQVSRTVTIEMSDTMRYVPARVDVKKGETIRFVVKNLGQLKHELVLGSAKDLKDHAQLMKKLPDMEHDEPNMVVVAPGKTGEVIWKFNKAGEVNFACLQPGHFEAGMKGLVKVSGAAATGLDHPRH